MALTPLDFPASPTVGTLYPDPPVTGQPTYKWDGAQWLSYAAASLPTPTKPANYGKKNYIINGAMMVSQENGTTAGTTDSYFPADQFFVSRAFGGTNACSQMNLATPSGSPNRIRFSCTAADTSIAAGDYFAIVTNIEGLRSADLLCGTALAKTVTLQFGVRAPAGTYTVSLHNAANARSYLVEFVVAAGEANIDVMKSVTVVMDQSGTWSTGNTTGISILWTLMSGTMYQGVANAWVTGNVFASANQFNWTGTVGNNFDLFDVSLTEGATAPPFAVPDYASELALCKRYFHKTYIDGVLGGTALVAGYMAFKVENSTQVHGNYSFPVIMRGSPTVKIWGYNGTPNAFSNVAGTDVTAGSLNSSQWGVSNGSIATPQVVNTSVIVHAHFNARL
jgi:hypothetical protein